LARPKPQRFVRSRVTPTDYEIDLASGLLMYRHELFRQHFRQKLFHRADINHAVHPCCVSRIESRIIGLPVGNYLLRNSKCARQSVAKPGTQNEIGHCPRRPAITAGERMNPIHTPHRVGGHVNRRGLRPLAVNVIAHLLHEASDVRGWRGLMRGAFNEYRTGAIVPGARVNILDGNPLEALDHRRA
jgi:hypothetical protein